MDNAALILECFKLLDDSTLSEERKTYWLNKISAGDFTDDDVAALDSELAGGIEKLDAAIEMTEGEIGSLEEQKLAAEQKALPVLRTAAANAPRVLEEATAKWKNGILQTEGEMMTQLETVRDESQTAEIETIRKQLGSK